MDSSEFKVLIYIFLPVVTIIILFFIFVLLPLDKVLCENYGEENGLSFEYDFKPGSLEPACKYLVGGELVSKFEVKEILHDLEREETREKLRELHDEK